MFAKENERGGREAKRPQSTSEATSENQDTGTSAPSLVSCLSVCRVIRKFPHCFNMRALFSLIVNQSRPQTSSARDGQEYARSQKRKHWFRE